MRRIFCSSTFEASRILSWCPTSGHPRPTRDRPAGPTTCLFRQERPTRPGTHHDILRPPTCFVSLFTSAICVPPPPKAPAINTPRRFPSLARILSSYNYLAPASSCSRHRLVTPRQRRSEYLFIIVPSLLLSSCDLLVVR